MKEHDLGRIAERLAVDFDGQIPFDVMIAVLRQCIASDPAAAAEQVEQTVRIRLHIRLQGHADT